MTRTDGLGATAATSGTAVVAGVVDLQSDTPDHLDRASAAAMAGDRQPVLDRASQALADEIGIDMPSARQIVDYLAGARAALGELPTQDTLILERFFDESGGMQLVLHALRQAG